MNIYPIQQTIVAKLQSDFTSAAVTFLAKDMPDNSNDYDAGVKVPIAYVVYVGSQALASNSTRVITQERKLHFNIECHGRKLYGADGLYVMRDILEQSMIGFEPLNCHRMYLLKDDISQTDDQIWVHVFQFECEAMLIQKEDSDPIIVPSFVELIDND